MKQTINKFSLVLLLLFSTGCVSTNKNLPMQYRPLLIPSTGYCSHVNGYIAKLLYDKRTPHYLCKGEWFNGNEWINHIWLEVFLYDRWWILDLTVRDSNLQNYRIVKQKGHGYGKIMYNENKIPLPNYKGLIPIQKL